MISIKILRRLNLLNCLITRLKKKSSTLKMFVFFSNEPKFLGETNNVYINNKTLDNYFSSTKNMPIKGLLLTSGIHKKYHFNIFIFIRGGGLYNQKQAINLAIARFFNKNSELDVSKFFISKKEINCILDLRRKERKKFGLKKARKESQYHKR